MIPDRLLTMSSTLLLAAALAVPAGAPAATAAPHAGAAGAAPPAVPAGSSGSARRERLPDPGDNQPFPYTIEIPAGWQTLFSKTVPGLFIGPVSGLEPEKDVRMIYLRVSPVSLADPAAVVDNIKKTAAAGGSWSAPLVEVRELGGVRGVLVRMDKGSGAEARSTLVLKMPLGDHSVDFMASAPRAEFERLLPTYQRVMLSVLPAR